MNKKDRTPPTPRELSAQERRWLDENAMAIAVHNERVAREGVLLVPYWAADHED